IAKEHLAQFQKEQRDIDRPPREITRAELCDQYLRTAQHQKPKTIERKTLIVDRIKSDWPGGANIRVSKAKPSDVQLWLAQYKFGPPARNLHLASIKAIFDMALDDRIITRSPAAKI